MGGGAAAVTFLCAASSAQAADVAVEWDPAWNISDAPASVPEENVLQNISDENIFLSADGSSYTASGQTVVILESSNPGETGVNVFGGAGMTTSATTTSEGPIEVDTWMLVTGGTYSTLVGGSYAQNYSGGEPANFTGDTHILLKADSVASTSPTVDYIIGGNYMDAQNAVFTGNSYISVEGGTVNGSIVGAGTSGHNQRTTFNGDTHIFVYTPLAAGSALNRFSLPPDFVIGGNVGIHNGTPQVTLNGNSNVSIDFREYAPGSSGSTSMDKSIVGDAWLKNSTDSTHVGNTSVTLYGTAENSTAITFSKPVVAGSWFSSGGSATLSGSDTEPGGNTVLSVTGGTFSNVLVGGSYISSTDEAQINSTISGSSTTTLDGTLTTSSEAAMVIGGSYVDAANATSTNLSSGAHNVTINSGTYAGDIIGGSHIAAGSGTVTEQTADITLSIAGGTFSGSIYGGSVTARDNAESISNHGAISISLSGGTINGNVYAGGSVASGAQGSVKAQSTQVEITNAVALGSGITISGSVENSNDTNAIAGDSTLLLSGENNSLANASFVAFNIVNTTADATIKLSTVDSSLTKLGAGELTLSSSTADVQSISALTVSEGALNTGNAALTQNGQGLSSLNVAAGSALTTSALTLASNAALSLGITSASSSQAIVTVSGELNVLGQQKALTLALAGVENLASGSSATLLSWNGGTTPLTLSDISWEKAAGQEAYTLAVENNSLVLKHTQELAWQGGAGTWNAESEQWDGQDNVSSNDKAVTFDSPAAGDNAVVSIGGEVTPQSIVVDTVADATYTFEAAASGGSIAAATGLTKNGEGTLVMNLANTYEGGTTVNAGTLEAAAAPTSNAAALGTGAVVLNGGTLLSSAENAIAGNALKLKGGELSYTANETRTLETAPITTEAGIVPHVSVAAESNVTWQYADAASLQNAIADGLTLEGGGTLALNSTSEMTSLALSGPITLSGAGTTLSIGSLGAKLLGSTSAPMALSLGTGTTLRIERPQANDATTIHAALSGEGTLEFANTNADANSALSLQGDNAAFTGRVNLGPENAALAIDPATSPAVLLDFSLGSPVGGEGSELNLNGLSFAMVNANAGTTSTAADINVNADTTQYAQTAGLNNTFTGAVTGAATVIWTLDATPVSGGQTNTLTGELSGFAGTLQAKGNENSVARWVLGAGSPQATTFAVTPTSTLTLNLDSETADNEFVMNCAEDIALAGVVSRAANLTQQGAGTLVLTGNNTSSGTLTIAEGSTVQLGSAEAPGQWGVAAGSTLAGNGTLTLVNGTLLGPLSAATGSTPVVNVETAAAATVDMGGSAGDLITGSITMAEGSILKGVGSSIEDKVLNLTLGDANIGAGAVGTAMVQFADTASSTNLGSTTEAINLDLGAGEVINLLRQHRVDGVNSYLTLTNGTLVTAADYSNVNFGANMNLLSDLGLRISTVQEGSLVLSGTAQGVYIAGEGEDPTEATGYQNFGAYQAVTVMPNTTLTLNLPGAPIAATDGAGATINNLMGAEDSALVVNNTDAAGGTAVVILNNTQQPGDNTTFGGSIRGTGGAVELVKTGAGTLSVDGPVTAQQLTAQAGTMVLNAGGNELGTLALEGGAVQLNSGTTTATTLSDSANGGSATIAEGATLATSGNSSLEEAQLNGPGTLLVTGELTLAESARLNGVALRVNGGSVALDETTGHTVRALLGDGTLNGTAPAGLSITGTGGDFSGRFSGEGTLTVEKGAQQRFSGGFAGGDGWNLTNNGRMELDLVRGNRSNAPLTLDTLTLGTGSETRINLNTDARTANLMTLRSIATGQGAVVNLSAGGAQNLIKKDTRYVLGKVSGGQAAGVLTTLTLDASNFVLMLLDAERSTLSVDANGNLLLNLVTNRTNTLAELAGNSNSLAAAQLLWDAALNGNTAIGTDIRRLLERLHDTTSAGDADRILAAVSGASATALSSAFVSDVQRQLRAIRNRTTMMEGKPCLSARKGGLNSRGLRFAAWINGEGDHRKMKADGYMPGYSLSSWGGTVGMDMSCNENTVAGLALTAMYGDLHARSADNASGDFDRYYISAFAKMRQQRWQHTLLGTVGRLDADLDRTVDFGTGSYRAHGDTKGWGYGLMYEIGYDIPMDEDANFTLQPIANVSWRYVDVDGYTENGSDAAMRVGDQDYNVVTFGAGLRAQADVGSNWFNRKAMLEGRALVKVDAGDREADARVAMLGGGAWSEKVRGAKLSAVGVELGAGLSIPLGNDMGSVFIDGSAELRNEYSNLNGTVGYRFEF